MHCNEKVGDVDPSLHFGPHGPWPPPSAFVLFGQRGGIARKARDIMRRHTNLHTLPSGLSLSFSRNIFPFDRDMVTKGASRAREKRAGT